MRKEMMMSIAPAHRTTPLLRTTLKLMAVAAMLGALFGLAPLGLDAAQAAETSHLRVSKGAYGSTQRVEVGLNKSLIIDLPANVGEVIVSQPLVAGAIMRSKQRAIVQGNASGDTNIFFLDSRGDTIAVLDLTVAPQRSDVAAVLAATLSRVLPGSAIRVDAVEDGTNTGSVTRVVLSGTAQSGDDIEKAMQIAAQFAGSPNNVASVLTTSTPQQVMLKVTIAEVNREVAKQLGINLSISANGLGATLLNNRGNDISSALGVANPGQIGLSVDAGFASIDATVRALQSNRGLRLLAEPVLTAVTGQEADFLVGGEFPIRETDPQTGNVTTSFKEYGVKLNFTPTVRSNGRIGLQVQTEASELLSAQGQLSKRRASTSVELPAGQTLAIGGLLQDSTRQQISRMPGLGDIPILGALFRSRDYVRAQTELVILVTPILAFPSSNEPNLPTDNMVISGDAEAIFLGHMEAIYGVGPDGMRGGYSGNVGFVLD